MSEWITDRLPTKEDAWNDLVWGSTTEGIVLSRLFNKVLDGEPWMPINGPAPYVKPEPKRWRPKKGEIYFYVTARVKLFAGRYHPEYDSDMYNNGNLFQTSEQAIEAARRVRETLLNYHKELNNE